MLLFTPHSNLNLNHLNYHFQQTNGYQFLAPLERTEVSLGTVFPNPLGSQSSES